MHWEHDKIRFYLGENNLPGDEGPEGSYDESEETTQLGPVVQSIVSLTSSLRVISLTVFADSKYNILIFFAEKMWVAFALQKLLTFFQQKISAYSTSFAKVISFALHDKKFCSLVRNKRGMSVGFARHVKNGTRGYVIVARNVLLARAWQAWKGLTTVVKYFYHRWVCE